MLHTHDIAVRGLEGLNDSAAENSGDDLMAQAHPEDRFGTDEAFRCDQGSPVGRGSARSGGKDHRVRIGKATDLGFVYDGDLLSLRSEHRYQIEDVGVPAIDDGDHRSADAAPR